jgi:hypothetical protein
MIRLRTASGNVGWCLANEKEAAALVASGQWIRADSLDYSRSKHGEIRQAEPVAEAAAVEPEPVKRGPGRPKKVAD